MLDFMCDYLIHGFKTITKHVMNDILDKERERRMKDTILRFEKVKTEWLEASD